MSHEPRKINIPSIIVVIVVVCLSLGYLLRNRFGNQSDVSNLMAMAGVSGAKVYTLEPTPDLMAEIEKAKSNPKDVIDLLERALRSKMMDLGKKRNEFSIPHSEAPTFSSEGSFAYATRIILLHKWKPGMTRKEIVQNYMEQTASLKTEYDFKNHAEDFLGFK